MWFNEPDKFQNLNYLYFGNLEGGTGGFLTMDILFFVGWSDETVHRF